MTKEELVKLDITIIRLKHEIIAIINKLPTSFIRDKDYIEKKKLLDSKTFFPTLFIFFKTKFRQFQ